MKFYTVLILCLISALLLFKVSFAQNTSANKVQSAETLAAVHWFANHCDGVLLADSAASEQAGGEPENNETYTAVQKSLKEKWVTTSNDERKSLCLKSLILFGPNGTTAKGYLTATPELQNSLPVDIRSLMGF